MARLLFVTSPPLRGPDVLNAQNELAAAGCKPGARDGYYGHTTEAAVRAFQRTHNLQVDGIIGPHTAELLAAPPEARQAAKKTVPVPLGGRVPPGLAALEWMRHRLGMKENPPYSNRCPVSVEFGLVGPWCAMTVSLAFKHGANLILGDGPGPKAWGYWPGRGFASVQALEAWCKTRGYWRGRTTPAAGMIAFYNFGPRAGWPGHTGIVERYIGGGKFTALEGNTGIGADADGGELMQRDRYVSDLAGLAWVTWGTP